MSDPFFNDMEPSKIKTFKEIEEEELKNRSKYGVNCWHFNKYESLAMWELYLKDNNGNRKDGVAVVTTIDSLLKTLAKINKSMYLGFVKYLRLVDHSNLYRIINITMPKNKYSLNAEIEYFKDPINRLFTKDIAYKHEKEVRAVMELPGPQKLDPESLINLIKCVIVSPYSKDNYVNEVKELISCAGLSKDLVFKSKIIDQINTKNVLLKISGVL